MKRDALISNDGLYRYWLTREWSEGPRLIAFIGLNPSIADALIDDPTMRRLVGFARAWGYDRLVMLNLFAYRATNPEELTLARDPVGIQNDFHLAAQTEYAETVVACWGNGGQLVRPEMERSRDWVVRRMFQSYRSLHCLGMTGLGYPKHPLYLPASTALEPCES